MQRLTVARMISVSMYPDKPRVGSLNQLSLFHQTAVFQEQSSGTMSDTYIAKKLP